MPRVHRISRARVYQDCFKPAGILCAAVCVAALTGCGSGSMSNPGGSGSPGSAITSVSVTCSPPSAATGGSSTCSAAVQGTGSYSSTVIWAASAGSISSAGAFTAPATVPASGSVLITATSTQDATESGTAAIAITAAPPASSITAVSDACSPASIQTGGTSTCTATVQGTGSYSPAVTWTASGGSISSTGAFTAPATIPASGLVAITATSTEDTTKSGTTTVTITAPPPPPAPIITSVSAACSPTSINAGGMSSCTATVQGTGSYSSAVTWTTTAGTISTSGAFTAPATVPASGSATITATSTQDTTKSGTATVTITTPPVIGVRVLTYHDDNTRSGLNAQETTLTMSNVNSTKFGKIGFYPMDGHVDAEPLYIQGMSIAGGTHNVLYAASEHDTVYAFDADSGSILWQKTMLASGEVPSDNRGCGQVSPQIGVTSTPVIDPNAGAHGTIYVVAMSKDSSGNYYQRLHALDLTTGAEMTNSPVTVQATYPGTGDNSSGGKVIFDPKQYKERPGLVLLNGTVYTFWSSHCDIRPYTGWIMGYNESTLAQSTVLNLIPNGSEGSIWASGAGPAVDSSGNMYILVANGSFETTLDANGFPSQQDYGNAFVKISTSGGKLAVADYFNEYNTIAESNVDEDLGSGGALVLPDFTDISGVTRHLAVGAGKDANVYIVDRDNMGKFNPNDNSNLYQELAGGLGGSEFAMPAYFNNTVYYGAVGDHLRAYPISLAKLANTPSTVSSHSFPYPGATPSISANGTSNGIVWAIDNSSPAILYAYDASDLTTELYDSNQAAGGRDQFGSGNKFITPMIANGKVYVGTPNGVAVFGLLP